MKLVWVNTYLCDLDTQVLSYLTYSLITITLCISTYQSFIFSTENELCGKAPNVILQPDDKLLKVHVDWSASEENCQFDCKAYWLCKRKISTSTDDIIHSEEVITI